jgi:hypothetical protein
MSLWDAVETPVEDQKPNWEDWCGKKFSEPPQMLTKVLTWADGDTSPAALDRLAVVVLGDLQTFQFGPTPYFYRITGTCIVGSEVIAVCELACSIKQFYGGSDDMPVSTDNDVD